MIVELAIIIPTLNERDNIEPVIAALERALTGIAWEAIFVDDDSTDGTVALLQDIAGRDPRIRVLHRIGRRGLSSACLEGMSATAAPYLAVMDADLQHDERLLPQMLDLLKQGEAELAVGSRYMAGGGTGQWSWRRRWISRFATRLCRLVLHQPLSDPMSGFFMLARPLFDQAVRRMSGKGFKILLDLIASAGGRVKTVELPYTFRNRHAGQSKLDTVIIYEYVLLLIDKLVGRLVPVRFIMFVGVGGFGAILHLSILSLCLNAMGMPFAAAQSAATIGAMILNFNLNNMLTHRDRRLRGLVLAKGMAGFLAICSVGAFANVEVARDLYDAGIVWWLAGLLGAVIGAVWNYAVSAPPWSGTGPERGSAPRRAGASWPRTPITGTGSKGRALGGVQGQSPCIYTDQVRTGPLSTCRNPASG